MTTDFRTVEACSSDILALQEEMIAGAMKMSGDQNEAHQLVHLTFAKAMESRRAGLGPERDLRLWLFSILRGVFHSVERQRTVRRERGFTVANQRAALLGPAA